MTAGETRWAECGSNLKVPSPTGIAKESYLGPRNPTHESKTSAFPSPHRQQEAAALPLPPLTLRYSCWGSWPGRCTVWCVPHCGTITMQRISFTWGLSGGLTPYRYPAIWRQGDQEPKRFLVPALCLIPFSRTRTEFLKMWPESPALKKPGGAYSKC